MLEGFTEDEAYDELYNGAGGVRMAAQRLSRRSGRRVDHPDPRHLDSLHESSLRGGATIAPLPLVLDDAEFQRIAAGAAQRAAMLQLLFHDLFCGPQRVLGEVLDAELVARVIDVHGWRGDDLRAYWAGADVDTVRFIYGPDLIRNASGEWLVLEDNIGCLGGVGNARWVLDQYLVATNLTLAPGVSMRDDLRVAVEAFLACAEVTNRPDEVVCLAGQAPRSAPNADSSEEARKRATLAAVGLATTSIEQRLVDGGSRPAAVINLGGTLGGSFRDLLTTWDADGGLPILNGPGIGLVANKAFLAFSDDLIRFYLGDEPIMSPPPTRQLDGRSPARRAVVKRTDGCEGSDVFFVDGSRRSDRAFVGELATRWGVGGGIVQAFVEPSRLPVGGPDSWCWYRVELRPITYVVGAARILVGEVPVGRATLNLGDRRANLVRDACALAVVREPGCGDSVVKAST